MGYTMKSAFFLVKKESKCVIFLLKNSYNLFVQNVFILKEFTCERTNKTDRYMYPMEAC